jgi:hypothetical protein
MPTASTFDPSFLRAIKRTFYTRVATPEEVCLQLRPRKRSWHMVIGGLLEGLFLGLAVGSMASKKLGRFEFTGLLEVDFWATFLFVVCGILLVFVLLPDAYLPRFELVLRANSNDVFVRGFAVEQRSHGGCCAVGNRFLWCNFYVDGVRYALVRRWWQFPFPISRGAGVLNDVVTRAKALLDNMKDTEEGRRELRRSADRHLWARVFGEALVTEREVVLVLNPPDWFFLAGFVGCVFVGGMIVTFWHAFYSPVGFLPVGGDFVAYPKSFPMWLPTAIVLLCTAIVGFWADPWFRRAVMVLPKGERTTRIQVGGRTIGESGFNEYTVCLDGDEGNYLYMSTRYWRGSKGTAFKGGSCHDAIERLRIWTGIRAPKEGCDG